MLPTMTQDQIDFLPFALRSATRAIETYCQRPLVMDSYDHILRPNNSIKLRLRARPIVEVSRVASTLMAGLVITYTGSAQTASVQTITGSPTSMAVVTLTFSSTIAGVTTTSAINVTTYATFDLLAAAINALGGGWGATVGNQMGSWSTGEAFGNPGVRGSVMEALDLNVYSRPLGQYQVDPDRGTIELGEFIPGGTLIVNPRVERWDTRRWGVRCTYRAGYAVTAADIALGYYSVPEDLQAACVMTCYAIMESAPMAGPVKSQSVKDRSYTLKDSHNVIPDAASATLNVRVRDFIPDAAKGLLASYVEVVF